MIFKTITFLTIVYSLFCSKLMELINLKIIKMYMISIILKLRNILLFQYFVEAGAMAVRRVKKADLKRIAKATGAAYLTSLTNMEGKIIQLYKVEAFLNLFANNYLCTLVKYNSTEQDIPHLSILNMR